MYYILNRLGEPVKMDSVLKWGQWMESHERHLARDTIHGVLISTVFLGIDHRYHDEENSPPVLWETMIFCEEKSWAGRFNEYQRRYSSKAEALAGHKEAVGKITFVLN